MWRCGDVEMWGDVRGFAGNLGANAANSHLEDWTKKLIDGIRLVDMKLNSCYWILIIYKASTSFAGPCQMPRKWN